MSNNLLAAIVSDQAKLQKRSVRLQGHDTSISLEGIFWQELQSIAKDRGISLNALVTEIDAHRAGGLSGALRVYATAAIKARAGLSS